MFDYVLLFQREGDDSQNLPKLVNQYPETIKVPNEVLLYIQSLAIPNNLVDFDIYTFNTPSNFCYDYSFKNGKLDAAVIIVSSHFRPLLYIDFFKAINQSFSAMHQTRNFSSESANLFSSPSNEISSKINSNSSQTQIDLAQTEQEIFNKFIFVYSLLISWGCDDRGNLIINYPFTSFTIKPSPDKRYYSPSLDFTFITTSFNNSQNPYFKANGNENSNEYSWTDGFDISPLFPYVDALWFTAIQNKGVMIVAPTATSASSAAIAFLSLFESIQYQEPYLLFAQKNDPRFTIDSLCPKKGKSMFKVVATTEDSYNQLIDDMSVHSSRAEAISKLNSNFSAIITIKSTRIQDSSPMLRKSYINKTTKLIKKMLSLLDLAVLSDPYFDLLEKPIDGKEYLVYMKEDLLNTILNVRNVNMAGFNNSLLVYPDDKSNSKSRTASSSKSGTQKSIDNPESMIPSQKGGDDYQSLDYSDEKCRAMQIEFIKNIQGTKSFKKWRNMNEDREQLRVSFLSMSPKESVEKIPNEDLPLAYSKVKSLFQVHQRDEHYRAILKKNLCEIKKRIKNLKNIV